jgi:hypothetical protein
LALWNEFKVNNTNSKAVKGFVICDFDMQALFGLFTPLKNTWLLQCLPHKPQTASYKCHLHSS